MTNATPTEIHCKGCGCTVPGPRHFCERCFRAMLDRSDKALASRPAPRGMTETEARAAAKPGQGIVRVRSGMGHGPAAWIVVGKERA